MFRVEEEEAKQRASMKQGSVCYLLRTGSLLGFFFNPEYGGNTFL
jgi:hypothetical protein